MRRVDLSSAPATRLAGLCSPSEVALSAVTMAQTGAVPVVDVSQLDDPRSLADAIKSTLNSTGFLFLTGHGLEAQAERMFEISGAFRLHLVAARAHFPDGNRRRTLPLRALLPRGDGRGEATVRVQGQQGLHSCVPRSVRGPLSADGRGTQSLQVDADWQLAIRSLDPSKPAPDLKEGFNTSYIAPGEGAHPPVPSQPLPNLLQEHADELAAFQHGCFSICQRLLQAFAVALDVRMLCHVVPKGCGLTCDGHPAARAAPRRLLHLAASRRTRLALDPPLPALPRHPRRRSCRPKPRRGSHRLRQLDVPLPAADRRRRAADFAELGAARGRQVARRGDG